MVGFSGIRLRFDGKASVHWTESHETGSGDNRRTETVHYSASEKYFNQDVLLYGICKFSCCCVFFSFFLYPVL
jgi:hypothetical protein